MKHANYHQVYDSGFFNRSDGKAQWDLCRLKVGDDLAAVAYALGFQSFEELTTLLGCKGDGRDPLDPDLDAKEQVIRLLTKQRRMPQSVLDVGGGRGEVAATFSWMRIPVQEIEPHMDAVRWADDTMMRFFQQLRDWPVINAPAPECLEQIDFEELDTVIFCEALEHIPEECFAPFWEKVGAVLRDNHGRLIVTNWIDYHPLHVSGAEHCRLTDDALYAELATGGVVRYKNGSHLVVDF